MGIASHTQAKVAIVHVNPLQSKLVLLAFCRCLRIACFIPRNPADGELRLTQATLPAYEPLTRGYLSLRPMTQKIEPGRQNVSLPRQADQPLPKRMYAKADDVLLQEYRHGKQHSLNRELKRPIYAANGWQPTILIRNPAQHGHIHKSSARQTPHLASCRACCKCMNSSIDLFCS
jgi:hypothetical protein